MFPKFRHLLLFSIVSILLSPSRVISVHDVPGVPSIPSIPGVPGVPTIEAIDSILPDHEFPPELGGEASLPKNPISGLQGLHGLPLTGPLTSPMVGPLGGPLVKAVAVLKGPGLTRGIIHLVQVAGGPTQITGTIIGLMPLSSVGFHFHEHPATGECESAGEHYNPTNQNHGGPNDPNAHLGDLGNVEADLKGISRVFKIDHKVSLVGKFSVIGRSLVVHTNTDDLGAGLNRESRKSGNSGGRLACGTVRFVNLIKG